MLMRLNSCLHFFVNTIIKRWLINLCTQGLAHEKSPCIAAEASALHTFDFCVKFKVLNHMVA